MKYKSLPKFDQIKIEDIPTASTLLFYGGTKITEFFGNTIYKHPYKPASFHAAFYVEDGLFLNVGKFKIIQEIKKEFRSTRRIDVISYPFITKEQRIELSNAAYLDTSKPKVGLSLPDYDWMAFLRFGFKFLKQSKKNDFCSENVCQLFGAQGIKVSDRIDYQTAPWHLFEYAVAHPDQCSVRSAWVGKDFK